LYRRQTHTPSAGHRIFRIVLGSLLMLLGAVMIFTPGPAIVLIPLGLMTIASVHPPLHHWLSVRRRWAATKWGRWRLKRREAKAARSR